MWQAKQTAQHLQAIGFETEIIGTETSGDRIQNTLLSQTQLAQSAEVPHHVTTGKGLFIKEVQDLILNGTCHMAVHSMKDLPVSQTPGLVLAGFLPAGPVRDVLVFAPGKRLAGLATGVFDPNWFVGRGSIGTTSMRRQALLQTIGLGSVPTAILRGNVATRLGRLVRGDYSAIVLAEAGLRRLGLFDPSCMAALDETVFIPACAQGVVGIETKADDPRLTTAIFRATENHTLLRIALERLVLDLLGGDCNSIIGIHCAGILAGSATALRPSEHLPLPHLPELHIFTATPDFKSMHTSRIIIKDPQPNVDTETQAVSEAIEQWSRQAASQLDHIQSFSELFIQAQQNATLVQALRYHLARHGHQDDVSTTPKVGPG